MLLSFCRRILIASVEKGGVIFVYDISNPAAPIWQSAIHPGAHGLTWAELFNSKSIVDLDPEGLVFIKDEDSPIGEFDICLTPQKAIAPPLSWILVRFLCERQ